MKTIFWISFITILLFSCGAPKETGYGHLSEIKEQKLKETSNLPFDFVFYRASDTLCKLYYKVDPKYLLRKNDSHGNLSAQFRIQVEFKNKSKFNFNIAKEYQGGDSLIVLDSIVFSAPESLDLTFEIGLADLNKHTIENRKYKWYRDAYFIPEDLLVIEKESRKPLVSNFIYNEDVDIRSNFDTAEFVVSSSSEFQSPGKRMFELFTESLEKETDTLESGVFSLEQVVEIINNCKVETRFKIKLQADELRSLKLTKLLHSDRQTIEPLLYLLRDEPITVNSWVKFWSEAAADDLLKAEKLIAEFNRRVEYANTHFSTHKLGWKTDRGMMYLLFGPPDRVIRDLRSEIWSYGFTNSVQREFVFQLETTLGFENYILERNIGYYEIELSAIQRWKNGWVRFGWDGNQ